MIHAKYFISCYPLFEMEKYLFVVSVAVEHSSVLVVYHLVDHLLKHLGPDESGKIKRAITTKRFLTILDQRLTLCAFKRVQWIAIEIDNVSHTASNECCI